MQLLFDAIYYATQLGTRGNCFPVVGEISRIGHGGYSFVYRDDPARLFIDNSDAIVNNVFNL